MHRIASLDALRGFNFFWILGGDGALLALDQMTQDKGPVVSAIGHFLGTQLTHVPWEGFRFYDLIFPLFIFITGVAIVLSLPRLVEREGKAQAHLRVLRRALLLYGLGLIYYGGISEQWGDIRFVGVLQRIAALLPVCIAAVPEFESARADRRLRGAARRLLGADDFRAGAGGRRRLLRPGCQSRQLDRCCIICPAGYGTKPAIPKDCSARCRRSAPA